MGQRTAHHPLRWILSLVAIGLLVAMGFNSCSEVDFSTDATGTLGGSGNPIDDPCLDPNEESCLPPPTLTDYNDNFTIPTYANKADVLLILDNSSSMTVDLQKLAAKLDGLIGILDQAAVAWQMCYTTTDYRNDTSAVSEWQTRDGSGNVVTTGIKVLRPSTPNKGTIFSTTVGNMPESGDGKEEGIKVALKTIKSNTNQDCFRSDAVLSVVIISDEDERSCGGRCQNYTTSEVGDAPGAGRDYAKQFIEMTPENQPETLIEAVKQKWPGRPFVNHSIVIRKDDVACYREQDATNSAYFGFTYAHLQRLTGGVLGNICAPSYTDALRNIGEVTRDVVNSVTLRCAPTSVQAVTLTPAMANLTWSQTGDKIVFSRPIPAGTVVNVKYTCAVR